MSKIYIIIALVAAASTVFVALPGVLEHASHYVHWLTIVVSGHHIAGEVAHAIHPQESLKA